MAVQASLTDQQAMKAELYGIDITFTVLAVASVALRFWARHHSEAKCGWDDWLVLVSMFLVFINFALNAVMIEHGLGLQAADVPLESLFTIGKAIYGDEIVYVVALATIKVAILVMYCRVFVLRSFKIAAWILSTITVVWSLMFIFICVFQCSPIPRAWNLTIPGKCLNLRAVFIGNAVPNIVTDAIILCMPLYHVWKLHVRLAQRLALTGIFLLGAFVIVASIYRFTTVLQLNPMNLSYTLKTPTTWSHVEVSVALISACLPTMRPLLVKFLRLVGVQGSTNEGSAQSAGRATIGTSKPNKRRMPTSKLEFSVLEEGRDEWPEAKRTSTDEVPLNGIQVRRSYEQIIVEVPKNDGWNDNPPKSEAWYPGR
ncbi:hypothetical protein LTR64_006153 [Lithohypha guttulata]|uniref:uncharacterized protein n=1 Tax=Lithohypha guttulata TaxID=1690604 RepID=UPI002DDF144B|nr:hypothetical protein LTR51_002049 [Lithohypha guttulata]